MNSKIRFGLLVAGLVGLNNLVFAQTVEQGKKFYYYTRYNSAKDALEKTLASNPNNIEATYWLGQTLLAQKDSVGAENLYSKALAANGNAPLLLAGMGEIELRKGKSADARQRFETAISLSKSKDVNVLNAIGKANVYAKDGDAAYAIDKLNLATQIKNFNNPETYVLIGDAYKKLIDGGNAVLNYQKALSIDPKYAEAKYRIGMIYLTQNNKDYFLPAFEDATTMDPNYGPAWYQLYFYWYTRDVNKAKEYLDKDLAVVDPDPSNDYLRASILWASGKFDEAITVSKGFLSSQGDKADPRFYKLIAYSYQDGKNDSVNAKSYLDQYFTKQKPDDFLPMDYAFRAQLLSKFPGNDSLVNLNYGYAVDKDTTVANKIKLTKEAADLFKKKGDKVAYAEWMGRAYELNKNPNQTDLYNWGFANYSAGEYKRADSIFCNIYETKYPTEIFGYLWCVKSKVAQDDSVGSNGYAVEAYQKLAEVARGLDSTQKAAGAADSAKWKGQIITAYSQLAGYYNNIKKEKETAIFWLTKILEVDPTNTDAPRFIEMLRKPAKQPAARPRQGTAGAGAKPAGGSTGK